MKNWAMKNISNRTHNKFYNTINTISKSIASEIYLEDIFNLIVMVAAKNQIIQSDFFSGFQKYDQAVHDAFIKLKITPLPLQPN